MDKKWAGYPHMHANFPWRTATASQVRAHIAAEPDALELSAYKATPLHFAAGFGASVEVIEALLDVKPDWASATCTWGDGPPETWKKAPLVFGLCKQGVFDEAMLCSAEVATLLASRCPESASDDTGNIHMGAPTSGQVGAAVAAAARTKLAAAAAGSKARQLTSLSARCEAVPPSAVGSSASDIVRVFVGSSSRPGFHELLLAMLAPECRTPDLLLAIGGIEQRIAASNPELGASAYLPRRCIAA